MKRYQFMNVLRVLSMIAIVFYHMVVTLENLGIRQHESVSLFYQNANMHIATVGVGLFFMLSGGGLMLSSKDKTDFSALGFYKKRFFKILIPFYIVYALYFVFFFFFYKVDSIGNMFASHPKPWEFVFTLLGMDAYLSRFGIPTYSLGIGEWFLGCLMLMYLIFPLLRKCMLKNKVVTMLVATVYYLAVIFTYQMHPYASMVPGIGNFTVKVYDFILGMFLVLILEKIPDKLIFVWGAAELLFIFCPVKLPINDLLSIEIQCVLAFLIFFYLERFFVKMPKFTRLVAWVSGFTYEYFLVHHVVIDHLSRAVAGRPFGNLQILLLFLAEIAIAILLTLLVKGILALPGLVRRKKAPQKGN